MASTIQVDKIQDTGGNTILQSDGSGTATTTLPVGFGGTGAATLAAAGLANTPAFFGVLASNQSISNATWTKVLIATEKWDTDGTFASNKFTPAVAGKYLFTYGFSQDVIDDSERVDMQLYKNGVAYGFGYIQTSSPGTNIPSGYMGSVPVEMNTTDYVELYIYQSSGETATLYANRTTFSAMKIIGA